MPSSHALIAVELFSSVGRPRPPALLPDGWRRWLSLELLRGRAEGIVGPRPALGGIVALAGGLLPVLPARVVLGDHSAVQVVAGAGLGLIAGVALFVGRAQGLRAQWWRPASEL